MVVVTTAKVSEMTKTTDFDVFYGSEHAPLYRALAMTLGDSDLAAEAIDEAMVRAYQRWAVVSRYDNPAGWVYRVAPGCVCGGERFLRYKPPPTSCDCPTRCWPRR
jgi:hypothetical protein